MFDTLSKMCYPWMYEARGYSSPFSGRIGRLASASGACCFSGNVAGQGCWNLWSIASIDQRLAPTLAKRWLARFEIEAARPATSSPAQTISSCHCGASDHRPMPRPVEVSVCSLDSGSRSGSYCQEIWRIPFRLDGRSLSSEVGFHASETFASCLRAGPYSGTSLAAETIPCYPSHGTSGESDDLLGRRDGNAFGPSGWTLLGPPRQDSSRARDGEEVPVQHDISNKQPGKTRVHGFSGSLHTVGVCSFSAETSPPRQAQTFSYYRRTSGTCGGIYHAMG